ncbi:MAG: hypothetical protein CVV42_04645 [Candidatus Riflebacteria bacterium HGW-Riflebacteria-2]|jgi:hypothetical protein|nr:MAG: hypothetical protein CVV42_04645 [Candidatus Riflebacteria bacterium HGW-Riflebacteria-2]
MSAVRDSLQKGLMTLIGRKDASVFQSLDNFTREINKLGEWQNLPEIPALAAGLVERLPWELQKDGSGLVSGRSVINLATTLVKKHGLTDELAVWAVETWALSLGLKLESPTARPAGPAKSAAPSAKATAATVSIKAAPPAYAQLIAKSRFGLIFGQNEAGVVHVFASWFREESPQQSAGLAASMVKIEAPNSRPLFSAPPPRRKTTGSETARTGGARAEPLMPAVDPTAPALKKDTPTQKPAKPATRAATKQAAPATPSARPASTPSGSGKVYYGSAESLYNQAVQLLPGHTGRPDVPEALAILNQAAKQGSIPARRAIGIVYLKGVGIKQDFATAANWLRLAAEGGDAEAQYHLGSLYQCGMGVEFSLEKAQNLLQRAAQQGHKEAQVLLKEILEG